MSTFEKSYRVEFLDHNEISAVGTVEWDDLMQMFSGTAESLALIAGYIRDAENSDDDAYESTMNLSVVAPKIKSITYSPRSAEFVFDTTRSVIDVKVRVAVVDESH